MFTTENSLCPSHVTRNAVDDPKNSEMFCALILQNFLVQT